MRDHLSAVNEAFALLAESLSDAELVDAGIAISCAIMERLTDYNTASDARQHVSAYIWGVINAYIDHKTEVKNG